MRRRWAPAKNSHVLLLARIVSAIACLSSSTYLPLFFDAASCISPFAKNWRPCLHSVLHDVVESLSIQLPRNTLEENPGMQAGFGQRKRCKTEPQRHQSQARTSNAYLYRLYRILLDAEQTANIRCVQRCSWKAEPLSLSPELSTAMVHEGTT